MNTLREFESEIIQTGELIPLYRRLYQSQDDFDAKLMALMDRLERRLYERLSIEEIEGISNVKCPYCRGGKSWVIKCGCGGLSCGGGVRREGNTEYHKCPWCQSDGIITGNIETLSGERATSHQTLPNRDDSKQMLKNTDTSLRSLPPGSKQVQKR